MKGNENFNWTKTSFDLCRLGLDMNVRIFIFQNLNLFIYFPLSAILNPHPLNPNFLHILQVPFWLSAHVHIIYELMRLQSNTMCNLNYDNGVANV